MSLVVELTFSLSGISSPRGGMSYHFLHSLVGTSGAAHHPLWRVGAGHAHLVQNNNGAALPPHWEAARGEERVRLIYREGVCDRELR